ncbi:hypothetical protein ACGK9R_00255 [Halomonas sp. HNIBRBA4712]|uniref:hypothetical protein n=1 Tax=Halomonas sp. HNIBRBA4712 TaxID=3373087 RepID=UPI0037467679
MSDNDQAAGLRQWASLRAGAAEKNAEVQKAEAPAPRRPLAVVGLASTSPEPVKARLCEWAALGRRWAATPESWDIVAVDATAPLDALTARYARWALWVQSDADAFAPMYRTLRLLHDNGGPHRLLALHEPGLPRRGLLENLQKTAANYLNIELLILAR